MTNVAALKGDRVEAPKYEMDGYIVTFYVIGPDMKVLQADGDGNVDQFLP